MTELDLELDWECDPDLPDGIELNEHTGTISGRVAETAETGQFSFEVIAEKHSVKWTGSYGITVKEAPVTRLDYPNGNVLIFTRNEEIRNPISPKIEGSAPDSFQVIPCEPYESTSGDLPEGIIFSQDTGAFAGTPTVISKTSWKVNATNSRGTFTSTPITIHVRRSPDERDIPPTKFEIPKAVFEPFDLQTAFDTFKPDESGKLGLAELGSVLRACGLTPTNSQVDQIFNKYATKNNTTFIDLEQMKTILEVEQESLQNDINLNEMKQAFEVFDPEKTGQLYLKDFRKIMMHGKNACKEQVIVDIVRTLDKNNQGSINYIELLDLFSRISFGARFNV